MRLNLPFIKKKPKLNALQRFSLYFFKRPRKTALLFLVVVLFGVASYTTLLKREGFPSIETPVASGQGTYMVGDPAKVDADVAKPLSDYLLKQDGVKSVTTSSLDNFYTAFISYEEKVDASNRSSELQKQVKDANILPATATLKIEALQFGFTMRGDDMVISFYAKNDQVGNAELVAKAKEAAAFIDDQDLDLVKKTSIIDQYQTAKNPFTGQAQTTQQSFERYGVRKSDETNYYNAVVIGIDAAKGADNLKLNAQVQAALDKLNDKDKFDGYKAVISASYAPQINQQIDELQRVLLEGLIAVLVVGSLVIAVRASIITVISMFTVIAITNGVLYLTGYSLNTITLFGLILGLSLIVDDTIIMVEAIDAQRRRKKNPSEVIEAATGKVGQAMIAATSTAALSFAPLLFVGGILGSFIQAIPITIISALVISLFVALVFIPLFARYILLGKNQLGKKSQRDLSAGFEARIAEFIAKPMLWAKDSKKKLAGVGIVAVLIGFGFIGAGGYLFQKVTFNIFPASKDSNKVSVVLSFPAGTTIQQAEQVTDKADEVIGQKLGSTFVRSTNSGMADNKTATLNVDLTDYNDREATAPQLVEKLKTSFEDFDGAKVSVGQVDAGPPASDFAAQIDTSQNRVASEKLANDVAAYLKDVKLTRPDGSIAKIESVAVANTSIYTRKDNKPYIAVTAQFVDDDTTTLVTLAKAAVEKEFDSDRVASYDLDDDTISYNFGQEDENQDSFATMAIAFPILLCVIYVLLAFQFRSFLQPLLIFMAIPFSLFGITLGLYATDNAFSFFAMLGFFALIGLSLKNTILLTDAANQARRDGMGAVDSAHRALAERFRPLIATSLTAVVSLIPLAISSPFWEGLAVVLIFGLLSSTFLVITVFPYYYLGAEYMRSIFRRQVTNRVRRVFAR
ncbi:efflux RND transporter permease subunit [Candidatus Saccharibacteria bacterium]|nr:efflux RND transporter permease subunit [Candidatus Saccharibacteria bacterium]